MKKSFLCGAVSLCILFCGCNIAGGFKKISDKLPTAGTVEITEQYTESPQENVTFTEAVQEETKEVNIEDFETFKQELYILGDSIAFGYGAYERVPALHVLAQQGMNLSTILETPFSYEYGEGYAINIISEEKPEYLIISMGVNEIGNRQPQTFAEKYKEIVMEIHAASPETMILVAGLTPVCPDAETEYVDNQNISEHNAALEEVMKSCENVYFVNIGRAILSDNGSMNSDYSGGDGIHLNGAAYDLLLEEAYDFVCLKKTAE